MDVTTLQACRDELNSILMTKIAIREVASDIDWKAALKKRGKPTPAAVGGSPGAKAWQAQALKQRSVSQAAKGGAYGKAKTIAGKSPSAGRRVAQAAKKGLGWAARLVR
jgi:hypothetical protein